MIAGRTIGRWVLGALLSAALHGALLGAASLRLSAFLSVPEILTFQDVVGVVVDEPEAEAESLTETAPEPLAQSQSPELPTHDQGEVSRPEPDPNIPLPEPEQTPVEPSEPIEPGSEVLALPGPAAEGDLSSMLVGGATVALLVRTAELSETVHGRPLREAMRNIPGFRLYLGNSGFDPLTDFSWMSLRTPNPASLRSTSLAAELVVDPDRARATISRLTERRTTSVRPGDGGPSRGPSLEWAMPDPPGNILFAGPSDWVREASEDSVTSAAREMSEMALVEIDGGPADLLVAVGSPEGSSDSGMFAGTSAPSPTAVILAADFVGEQAHVIIRFWFDDEASATRFSERARAEVEGLSRNPLFRLVDLPSLLESLVLSSHEPRVVTASLQLDAIDIRRALILTGLLVGGPDSVSVPSR